MYTRTRFKFGGGLQGRIVIEGQLTAWLCLHKDPHPDAISAPKSLDKQGFLHLRIYVQGAPEHNPMSNTVKK